MPFPKTESEFAAAGYKFKSIGKCSACNAEIEWWTTPSSKQMPLDAGTLEPHWSTCPNADEFRRGK